MDSPKFLKMKFRNVKYNAVINGTSQTATLF